MIAGLASPASAPGRRPRLRDARHPHGGWREVAEPGAGDRPRAPRRAPGAEALFPRAERPHRIAVETPSAEAPAAAVAPNSPPSQDDLEREAGPGAECALPASAPARGRSPIRAGAAERELLAGLAGGALLAAAALCTASPAAGAELWLTAAAVGSVLALLALGRWLGSPAGR